MAGTKRTGRSEQPTVILTAKVSPEEKRKVDARLKERNEEARRLGYGELTLSGLIRQLVQKFVAEGTVAVSVLGREARPNKSLQERVDESSQRETTREKQAREAEEKGESAFVRIKKGTVAAGRAEEDEAQEKPVTKEQVKPGRSSS